MTQRVADDSRVNQSPPRQWTGVRRIFGLAAGFVCTGLGVAGLALPVLPATPFLLLAALLFLRTSPAFHARLRNSKHLGRPIRDWEDHGGIRRRDRWFAVGLVICGSTASLAILRPAVPMLLVSLGLIGTGLLVIGLLPSAKERHGEP